MQYNRTVFHTKRAKIATTRESPYNANSLPKAVLVHDGAAVVNDVKTQNMLKFELEVLVYTNTVPRSSTTRGQHY